MTWALIEPYFVLALLVVVFATMVTERFRVDVVAMIGVCLLLVTGVLSTKEVLAVFSNEAPITVAAMFVLSAALERTGVVEKAGTLLSRYASGSPLIGMFTLTAGAATVSAFMNNTPVVVILTPVTIALAHSLGLSASKLLIPLSYATVLGGTCSLIGTSTNIVANGAAVQQGLAAVQPVRDLAGRHPADHDRHHLSLHGRPAHPARPRDLLRPHGGHAAAPVPDRGAGPAGLAADRQAPPTRSGVAKKLNARVIDVIRDRISLASEMDKVVLQAGDRIVLRTNVGDVHRPARQERRRCSAAPASTRSSRSRPRTPRSWKGIVGPHSRFVGYRLADLNLRRQYSVYILAVHRQGENLGGNFDQVRLAFGDTILMEGPPEGLKRLFEQGALVSLSEPTEQPLRRDRGWLAISALAAVIVLATFEVLPISALALIASVVVIVGGCLDADEAYSSLRWPMLMLIFGSLALGRAMETSGAAQLVVDGVMQRHRGTEPGHHPLGHLPADDDPDRVPEQQRDRDPAHADRDRPAAAVSASIRGRSWWRSCWPPATPLPRRSATRPTPSSTTPAATSSPTSSRSACRSTSSPGSPRAS